jgi:hypothetical protein
MQTADFDVTDFDKSKQSKLDENLLVKFYYETVPDKTQTLEQGRPISKEVVFVSILVAGTTSGAVRPARPNDIARFPRHHAAFMARVELPTEGTPLTEWPVIARSMCEQFAFMNIKTVEQLAALNDNLCSQIMGGNGFKRKAQEFLEYASDMKDASDKLELKKSNEELVAQNAVLTEQLSKVLIRLDAMDGVNSEFNERQTADTEPIDADIDPVSAKTALDTPPKAKRVYKKRTPAKKKAAKKK